MISISSTGENFEIWICKEGAVKIKHLVTPETPLELEIRPGRHLQIWRDIPLGKTKSP